MSLPNSLTTELQNASLWVSEVSLYAAMCAMLKGLSEMNKYAPHALNSMAWLFVSAHVCHQFSSRKVLTVVNVPLLKDAAMSSVYCKVKQQLLSIRY